MQTGANGVVLPDAGLSTGCKTDAIGGCLGREAALDKGGRAGGDDDILGIVDMVGLN